MKKSVLLIIAIFMLSACSHDIPIADIEFMKIKKNPKNKNSYLLYFLSNVELIDNLYDKHTGALLECLFKNKTLEENDFIDNDKYFINSVADMELLNRSSSLYHYSIVVRIIKLDNDGSTNFLDKKNILGVYKLLNKEPNCLSCAVTAVAYLQTTKRYISNTMCLPKSEMIKVMKN